MGGRAARSRHRFGRPRRTFAEEQGGPSMTRWFAAARSSSAGGAASRWAAELADPGTYWAALALIGGAIAAGRAHRAAATAARPLPISFALHGGAGAARVGGGRGARACSSRCWRASWSVPSPRRSKARLLLFVERLAEGLGAVARVPRRRVDALGRPTERAGELLALAAAVGHAHPHRRGRRGWCANALSSVPMHGRTADLALSPVPCSWRSATRASTVPAAWVSGDPLVFTIPLLAAWYSYEHLDEIRRTYDQTIRSLGAAPELGGMVRDGSCRARRVDSRSPSAHELGFSRAEIEQLETAALLHHLGQVCIDEPEDGRPPDSAAIAKAGAEILRRTQLLAPAGDIIAAEAMPYRDEPGSDPALVAAADPQGHERVRRAVAGALRPRVRRARSAVLRARLPLRRAGARRARDRLDKAGLLAAVTR